LFKSQHNKRPPARWTRRRGEEGREEEGEEVDKERETDMTVRRK